MSNRRQFIAGLGSAAAWPLAARAQQPDRMRRIGLLLNGAENDPVQQARVAALREGLAKLDWVEGRNLRIDVRFAAGDSDRARTYAAELVRLAPDVIVTSGNVALRPLQQATRTVPIAIYASYDVQKDFEPVALIAGSPVLIVARKDMPANDLQGLIAWLKANPGKALQGTAGVGSIGHVGGALFQKITGTRIQHVPYRGAGLAMQDLVAGQLDIAIDSPITSLPQVRAGAIKAYAVTAKSRLASAPEIPTADQAGLPGLIMSPWFGLFAPKGTPNDIIGTLNAAVVDALADPIVRRQLADLGQEIFAREQQTPEALGVFQRAEIEKWWPIIKAAGIKGE
jgi:tripartite-type tricarboxylate transporter receptor subunit TctC